MLDDNALNTLEAKITYLVRTHAPHRHPVLDVEDVAQDATVGALQAVRAYDPGRGLPLTTYAEWRILSAIQEGYRRVDDLSRRARAQGTASPYHVSLDQPLRGVTHRNTQGGFWHLYQVLPSAVPPPEAMAERHHLRAALEQACMRLPLRWRLVLHWYYAEELTMAQVGARLGVTESRISQIHIAALARLRTLLKDWNEETNNAPATD